MSLSASHFSSASYRDTEALVCLPGRARGPAAGSFKSQFVPVMKRYYVVQVAQLFSFLPVPLFSNLFKILLFDIPTRELLSIYISLGWGKAWAEKTTKTRGLYALNLIPTLF